MFFDQKSPVHREGGGGLQLWIIPQMVLKRYDEVLGCFFLFNRFDDKVKERK